MKALVDGSVDAFVYDTRLLLYLANQIQDEIIVLPQTFDPQGYGIALPPRSPLYKPIDITLLETISEPVWLRIQDRYLSPSERYGKEPQLRPRSSAASVAPSAR